MTELYQSHAKWHHLFEQERERLLATLGRVTAGGIIENIQHVGATSVPGVPALPCVDVMLAISPFPLESSSAEALHRLGYVALPREEKALEQRFRHQSHPLQITFVEAGSDLVDEARLLRDFLRHDEKARRLYAAQKMTWATSDDYHMAKSTHLPDWCAQAHDWWVQHYGFEPVRQVADELSAFPHAWYISSGWALDLFLGDVSRFHHDIDVVLSRLHQLELQAYLNERGWQFVTPLDGRLELWPRHMRIEFPRHQIHAHRDGAFIDCLLTDIEHGVWRYRRDPTIVQTTERIGLQDGKGIPFLAPELVLLFKSKNTGAHPRPQDQHDFDRILPALSPDRRLWLQWALTVLEPDHPWLRRLEEQRHPISDKGNRWTT